MTNSALFLVVLVTAVFMVVAAMALAIWLSPKSYNALKGEPYECGIETRGPAWVQFRVGLLPYSHTLFGIRRGSRSALPVGNHLQFDRYRRAYFGIVLYLYFGSWFSLCVEKGGTGMEVKNIKIKNMTTADFKDNEYLEQYVEQLREGGVNVAIAKLDNIIN